MVFKNPNCSLTFSQGKLRPKAVTQENLPGFHNLPSRPHFLRTWLLSILCNTFTNPSLLPSAGVLWHGHSVVWYLVLPSLTQLFMFHYLPSTHTFFIFPSDSLLVTRTMLCVCYGFIFLQIILRETDQLFWLRKGILVMKGHCNKNAQVI